MKPGTCIHFNGLSSAICRANHNYLSVATPLTQEQLAWHNENYPELNPARSAIAHRVPCFARNNVQTCPDFREPTQAELDEFDASIKASFKQVFDTRAAIAKYLKENGLEEQDTIGQIPCPVCEDGVVRFSYAGAYNGHIHAVCNTAGCVQWME